MSDRQLQSSLWSQDWNNFYSEEGSLYRLTTNLSNISPPPHPRRRNSENSISKNYEMGNSAVGIWLRIEIYTRRLDPPRWCLEQTRLWRRRWQWSSLFCSGQYLLRPILTGDPVRHQNWSWIELTLSRCHQTNKKRHLETVLRSRERNWTTERRLDRSQWNHLSRSCAFHSTKLRPKVMVKAHEIHQGKNATETAVRMMACWPGISQDVLRYVSKCKECQENRPSPGENSIYLAQSWNLGKTPLGLRLCKGSR